MSSESSITIDNEIELVPTNCFIPIDVAVVYGRIAPLEVDLGCGDGALLAALAAQNPAHDFLGIERLAGRVRSACRKIQRNRLSNARILRFEIRYAVEQLLPPGSVSAFYLLFPDPWPKRRHAGRRLVNGSFLVSLHSALVANGTVRIATDDAEYFRQMSQLFADSTLFEVIPDAAAINFSTKFEGRFREQGLEIHRVLLRKV